jgi:hypothetical protein
MGLLVPGLNCILGSRLGFKWFRTNQTGKPIFDLSDAHTNKKENASYGGE